MSVTGWFLPSKDELNALDTSNAPTSFDGVGGLSPNVYYWSSSQAGAYIAWFQLVGFGGGDARQFYVNKYFTVLVRAVRAF